MTRKVRHKNKMLIPNQKMLLKASYMQTCIIDLYHHDDISLLQNAFFHAILFIRNEGGCTWIKAIRRRIPLRKIS